LTAKEFNAVSASKSFFGAVFLKHQGMLKRFSKFFAILAILAGSIWSCVGRQSAAFARDVIQRPHFEGAGWDEFVEESAGLFP
jgi:hypothetical protein